MRSILSMVLLALFSNTLNAQIVRRLVRHGNFHTPHSSNNHRQPIELVIYVQ